MLLTRQQVRSPQTACQSQAAVNRSETAITTPVWLKMKLVSEQRQIMRENKQAKAKAAASKVRRVTSARKEPGVEMAS